MEVHQSLATPKEDEGGARDKMQFILLARMLAIFRVIFLQERQKKKGLIVSKRLSNRERGKQ